MRLRADGNQAGTWISCSPEDVWSTGNETVAAKPVPATFVSVSKNRVMMLPVDVIGPGKVLPQMREGTAPGPVITSR
jgi:hypothetical protein